VHTLDFAILQPLLQLDDPCWRIWNTLGRHAIALQQGRVQFTLADIDPQDFHHHLMSG
jgi:hypothetical protein